MLEIIKERVATFNRALNEIPEVKYVGDPILRQQTEYVGVPEGVTIGDKLGKYYCITEKWRALVEA